MALADLTWSYRDLVFGEGTAIYVNRAEGFEGFEARTADADQPRGHGAIRGLDYVAPRTVAFELALIDTTEAVDSSAYEALYASVRAAFTPSLSQDYPLIFKRPGQPERQINCRPIQLTRTEDFLRFNRFGFPPIVLRAADPRIYSTTEQTVSAPVFAAATGGFELPADLPVDFGTGTQVEAVVTNAGTAEAYPLVRFYGPISGTVTGVKLTNTTTGQILQVNTTITSGQILSADMSAAVTGSNALVVSLDGASRYGSWALPRDAFYLAPGSNALRFEVIGTSTNALATITWRDTWTD